MKQGKAVLRKEDNKLRPEDRPAHDWYRFVLSFPPHLVRTYLTRFDANERSQVLDPFCGTGTTLVECKKHGVPSVGIEANPLAAFASRTKIDWSVDPEALLHHARDIAAEATRRLRADGYSERGRLVHFGECNFNRPALRELPDAAAALLLANSISPLPLHRTLVLMEVLQERNDERFAGHERLALARSTVYENSNLHFGPEVGVSEPKRDAPVISNWLATLLRYGADLGALKARASTKAIVHLGDSRNASDYLRPNSIDVVITSPPYPNEKDYSRTTRLESVLLGFMHDKAGVRAMKKTFVRSNTRSVYTTDDDHLYVAGNPEVERIANEIEARRIALQKTSGFERQYHRVTKLYFGGMAKHLAGLAPILRSGAQLAYVVGDQASYLRIMIRTGELLADIAKSIGYEVVGIDLFRTRLATATREQLREEVVILRWPGATGRE